MLGPSHPHQLDLTTSAISTLVLHMPKPFQLGEAMMTPALFRINNIQKQTMFRQNRKYFSFILNLFSGIRMPRSLGYRLRTSSFIHFRSSSCQEETQASSFFNCLVPGISSPSTDIMPCWLITSTRLYKHTRCTLPPMLTRFSWAPTISLGSHQNIGLHTGARANVALLTSIYHASPPQPCCEPPKDCTKTIATLPFF